MKTKQIPLQNNPIENDLESFQPDFSILPQLEKQVELLSDNAIEQLIKAFSDDLFQDLNNDIFDSSTVDINKQKLFNLLRPAIKAANNNEIRTIYEGEKCLIFFLVECLYVLTDEGIWELDDFFVVYEGDAIIKNIECFGDRTFIISFDVVNILEHSVCHYTYILKGMEEFGESHSNEVDAICANTTLNLPCGAITINENIPYEIKRCQLFACDPSESMDTVFIVTYKREFKSISPDSKIGISLLHVKNVAFNNCRVHYRICPKRNLSISSSSGFQVIGKGDISILPITSNNNSAINEVTFISGGDLPFDDGKYIKFQSSIISDYISRTYHKDESFAIVYGDEVHIPDLSQSFAFSWGTGFTDEWKYEDEEIVW